jgi:hypothetical protein
VVALVIILFILVLFSLASINLAKIKGVSNIKKIFGGTSLNEVSFNSIDINNKLVAFLETPYGEGNTIYYVLSRAKTGWIGENDAKEFYLKNAGDFLTSNFDSTSNTYSYGSISVEQLVNGNDYTRLGDYYVSNQQIYSDEAEAYAASGAKAGEVVVYVYPDKRIRLEVFGK